MKKSLIIFSIACACASGAFADHGVNEQWQTPWFNGIGFNATTSSLDPTNGTWTLPESGYKIENKKLVLDQDGEADPVSFAIGGLPTSPTVDSGTIVEITAKAKFYPVLETELNNPPAADAKVAFAVVKKSNGKLSYYGWVKHNTDDWLELEGVKGPTEEDAEHTVMIRLDYRMKNAEFYVNGESAGSWDLEDITANPTGFSIAGCGTVTSVDGEVQYNVAKIDDKGYATLDAAVKASKSGDTVEVLRETSENVTMKDGITIADNGKTKGTITVPTGVTVNVKPTYEEMVFAGEEEKKGESGVYAFPCGVTGDGTVNVVLPSPMSTYKEVDGSPYHTAEGVAVKVRTKNSILNSALESVQDLGGLNNNDTLRDYLTTNLQAYVAAQANKTDITAGLTNVAKAVSEGGNGFALYEIFLLDIAPDAKVGIVTPPAGDTSTDAIGISFPFPIRSEYSETYDIRYKEFGKDDEWTQVDKSTNIIPVPLQTGTYKICIKLTLGLK